MILDKLLTILAQFPMKSQKIVLSKIDFSSKTPTEVYRDVLSAMKTVAKTTAQRDMLELYSDMRVTDADILTAFGSKQVGSDVATFDEEQLDFIKTRVYRNREGNFRLIPSGDDCSVDNIPIDGLEADEPIISARLAKSTLTPSGVMEKFDGFATLKTQPYEGPYDGLYKDLAPNLQRVNVISSFDPTDKYGFFVRDGKMFRNVCAQMTAVNTEYVTKEGLERAMLLLFIVSGGKVSEWNRLYSVIHFMVRFPESSMGIILYLNDFDAGGNGKSKLVGVLQTMFGRTFTSFAPQQMRFTMSMLGKRLVSISEFEDNAMNPQLQGIMKSMTGRDKFQYEGKGVDPIVADTYQNFVISSNRYIYFEDNGIKRRLQNFHCNNVLHAMLTTYCHDQSYLNDFFGNVFDDSAKRTRLEMAHSLLNYILNDDVLTMIPVKPQQIVLGGLRNPVLRALFSSRLNPDSFIVSDGDGSRMDIYRLAQEAKPEQLNYAAGTLQSWFPDANFVVARDGSYMTTDLPEKVLARRLMDRLAELDKISKALKSKTKIPLECGKFREFDSETLFDKYLGDAVAKYNIPVVKSGNIMEVC